MSPRASAPVAAAAPGRECPNSLNLPANDGTPARRFVVVRGEFMYCWRQESCRKTGRRSLNRQNLRDTVARQAALVSALFLIAVHTGSTARSDGQSRLPGDDIFKDGLIPKIRLDLSRGALDLLRQRPRTYVRAT